MAFNASLAIALSYAPQIGTPSDAPATKPTNTQAAFLHARSCDYIRRCLREAGVSSTFTASTAGAGWAADVEAMLTSGRCLLARGSVGKAALGSNAGSSDGDPTATTLLRMAQTELDRLREDRNFRLSLIADGGADTLPLSGFASSDWSDGRDTSISIAPDGDGGVLYIPTLPVIQDGDDL